MRHIATICLMCACLPAFAEVKAVIEGPETAKPGDLVVLSGKASIGDGVLWVSPEGVQTLTCSERELAFAVGTPGRYRFGLIVADTEANIEYTTHTVVIGTPQPGPDPKPDPQPTPGEYDSLREMSLQNARRLADADTARGLADAIRKAEAEVGAMCARNQCPTLPGAKAYVVQAIEAQLARRAGPSLRVDWLNGWRRPMDQSFSSVTVATVEQYRAAMRAIATGLEQAAKST